MPLSPRWRRAIDRSLTVLTGAVFRQHYGDGRSIEQLEKVLGIDRIALEAARGGLREVVRQVGAADGLAFDQWPPQRLDRLLRRLAAWSPGPCPSILEVVEGHHRDHVHTCARCDRTFRLVQAGVLTPGDLVPPTLPTVTPTARIVAVHFHPDARHHRLDVARECPVPCFPVGDDLLIVDLAKPDEAAGLLALAAEVGPSRDHLRAAVLDGVGRWSSHGLLGPLVDRAEAEVRSRSWGATDGLVELPPPLPEPPSARRWWTGVGAVALLGIAVAAYAVVPEPRDATWPMDVEFTGGRGGVWAEFDVDDRATVLLVRESGGGLDVIVPPAALAKAHFATGDGRYRLHTMGTSALVASVGEPPADLDAVLASVADEPDPITVLAGRLLALDPHADVHTWYVAR